MQFLSIWRAKLASWITRALRTGYVIVDRQGQVLYRCRLSVELDCPALVAWFRTEWRHGFFLTLVSCEQVIEIEMVVPLWSRLLGVRLIYGRDQSAARAAWQANRSAKNRLTQFLEHLPVPAWVVAPTGEMVATNEAANAKVVCRDSCSTPRKICTEDGGFWHVLRMRSGWKQALAQVVDTRQPYTITASQVACRSWQITLVPLGAGELVEGVGAVALDITSVDRARAMAENAVRQMRVLAQHAHRAREEERQDISREIHDHLGQGLTVLLQDIHRLARKVDSGEPMVSPLVSDLVKQVETLMQVTRQMSLNLRPEILNHLGLEQAVDQLVTRLRQRMGVRGVLTVIKPFTNPPPALALHMYRCVQEGLNNILKHSKASRFEITLSCSFNMYYLSISDNGIGIPMSRRHTDRLGLLSLRERVALHSGEIALYTRPEFEGTELLLSFSPQAAFMEEVPSVERRAVDRGSE